MDENRLIIVNVENIKLRSMKHPFKVSKVRTSKGIYEFLIYPDKWNSFRYYTVELGRYITYYKDMKVSILHTDTQNQGRPFRPVVTITIPLEDLRTPRILMERISSEIRSMEEHLKQKYSKLKVW